MCDKKRILTVDDNPDNFDVIRDVFEDAYSLTFATNGFDAMRVAVRSRPDIILLDVVMPGMDGIELCANLRALHGLNNCRIIMLSAKAMPFEQSVGIRAGADLYVTKPFDESALFCTVQQLLDGAPVLIP